MTILVHEAQVEHLESKLLLMIRNNATISTIYHFLGILGRKLQIYHPGNSEIDLKR